MKLSSVHRTGLFVLIGVSVCFSACKSKSPAGDSQRTVISSSSASSDPKPTPSPKESRPKGLFWTVKSDTSTLYLLGSIHVGRKDFYPLHSTVEKAFAASQILALELAMDQQSQMNAGMQMMQEGSYKGSDSLGKHVSAKTTKSLADHCKKKSLNCGVIEGFKPWMASIFLVMQELQTLGYQPENGIDLHFQHRATKDNKKIVAVETLEDQLGVFRGLSPSLQESMLQSTLTEMGSLKAKFDEITNAWIQGDAAKLETKLFEEFNKEPEAKPLIEKLFTVRNIRMAKAAADFLKQDKTVFFVVGSGHMVGPDGIVSLLKKDEKLRIEKLSD